MDYPGSEQLAQRDLPEFRVKSLALKVVAGEVHLNQALEIYFAKLCEGLKQFTETLALALSELRGAIELVEWPGLAGEYMPRARNPIGALTMNQVPDNVIRRPCAFAFRGPNPCLGLIVEQRAQGRRCT